MEAQGPIPELLRKVLTAYETVSAGPPGGMFPLGWWRWMQPLPGTGDPKLAAPIPVPGEADGGLRGGAAQRVVLWRHRLSPIGALGPRNPLPALPAPCAGRNPMNSHSRSRFLPLCWRGPGCRPGAAHTAPGRACRGGEGQTPAVAPGRGAAPTQAPWPPSALLGVRWGRGPPRSSRCLSPLDDPDQPDADRVGRRGVQQAHPGAAGRWVPGGQPQPRCCSVPQSRAHPEVPGMG